GQRGSGCGGAAESIKGRPTPAQFALQPQPALDLESCVMSTPHDAGVDGSDDVGRLGLAVVPTLHRPAVDHVGQAQHAGVRALEIAVDAELDVDVAAGLEIVLSADHSAPSAQPSCRPSS